MRVAHVHGFANTGYSVDVNTVDDFLFGKVLIRHCYDIDMMTQFDELNPEAMRNLAAAASQRRKLVGESKNFQTFVNIAKPHYVNALWPGVFERRRKSSVRVGETTIPVKIFVVSSIV